MLNSPYTFYVGAIGQGGGLFSSNGLVHFLSSTECNGSENRLIDCPSSINATCPTQEEAVVFCQGM